MFTTTYYIFVGQNLQGKHVNVKFIDVYTLKGEADDR